MAHISADTHICCFLRLCYYCYIDNRLLVLTVAVILPMFQLPDMIYSVFDYF